MSPPSQPTQQRAQSDSACHPPASPPQVFEPELWTRMVSGKKYELYPKCTLDHACYCEANEHCADGFGCFSSPAFPQFKTCRPIKMN